MISDYKKINHKQVYVVVNANNRTNKLGLAFTSTKLISDPEEGSEASDPASYPLSSAIVIDQRLFFNGVE